MPRERTHPGVSEGRRRFLKEAVTALKGTGLGLVGSILLPHDGRGMKRYAPKIEAPAKERIEFGRHTVAYTVNMRPGLQIDEKALRELQASVVMQSPEIVRRIQEKVPVLPAEVPLVHEVYDIEHQVEFIRDKDRAIVFESAARSAIAHATEFWKHPRLREPRLRFEIPDAKAETDQELPTYPADQSIIIQFIDSRVETFYTRITTPLSGDISIDFRAKRDESHGVVGRHFDFDFEQAGRLDIQEKRLPVLLSIKDLAPEEIPFIHAAVTEILHVQISEYTNNRVVNDVGRFTAEHEEQIKTSQDVVGVFNRLMTHHGVLEEAVVHGIGVAWQVAFDKKNGRKRDNDEKDALWQRAHPGTREVYGRLERGEITIRDLIDQYISNPESIEAWLP